MFGDNITKLRTIHGYSQEEVAEKIEISRQAYAKWEKGITIPDIDKCKLLADIYGVSLDELIRPEKADKDKPLNKIPKGKNIWGSVKINERGQVVIPKAAREKFNLIPGQRLILLSEDGEGYALVPEELFNKRIEEITKLASNRYDD